jgi:hypothetical protein
VKITISLNTVRSLRIIFVLCAIATGSSSVFAQKYFFNKLEMATGQSPQSVAVGDFNRDGLSDFAVTNNLDNTVSVYLGKKDGTFAAPVNYDTGMSPAGIVTADFNSDGKLDLAVVNSSSNSVSILLGSGTGTFQTKQDYATGSGPVALVAADFNGDNKLDLAVANNTAGTLSVLINTGTGTFKSKVDYTTGSNPTSVAAGHFNADGFLDLAVGSYGSNEISILLGSSSGTFTAGTTITNVALVWSVVTGDFDGDGKTDLIAGTLYGVALYLGNGDGTFTYNSNLAAAGGAYALLAQDLNGDKKPDVIIIDRYKFDDSTTFTVFLNTTTKVGNPTFAYPPRSYATGYQPSALALGDFNRDGKLDAVAVGSGSNTVSVMLGDGKGAFDPGVTSIDGGQQYYMVAADFNNDHNVDLAFSGYSGTVDILLGKGDGTFKAPKTYNVASSGEGIVAADFNGDGFIDLAVADKISNTVSVLLNNKAGGFKITGPYATGKGPTALVAGNFTLRGHADLAVVNYTDSSVSILPNDGTGKFGAPVTTNLASNALPDGITAGDFNHDGHLDLAVANANSTLSILLNNNGTFPTHTDITVGAQAVWITSASLRGDGVLDLVAVIAGVPGGADVLLGNDDGTFAKPVFYASGTEPTSVAVGDFNADKLLDLVVTNGGDNTVAILPGNGDGTFGPYSRFEAGGVANPEAVAAADFNNDGFLDFITANSSTTYTAYMNTPVAAISPSRLAFPVTHLGTTSKPKSATLYNSGIATLTPKESVTGDYAISSNGCPTALPSGSNCSVSVAFTPTDINARIGALTFTDNATVPAQKVSLSGTGTEVKLSPTSLNFGAVKVGNTSQPQTVTVTNLSKVNSVTFSSIGLGGADAGDFLISSNTCPPPTKSLGPGKSCKVGVEFKPTTTGTRNATLLFTDDGGGSPQKVGLSGTGN